jgi:hypothetical protein
MALTDISAPFERLDLAARLALNIFKALTSAASRAVALAMPSLITNPLCFVVLCRHPAWVSITHALLFASSAAPLALMKPANDRSVRSRNLIRLSVDV